MERPCIQFFTDNCVADSVGNMLTSNGHGLTRLRECMARDTKDPLIALACMESGHVLVSHDNDFREIARRLQMTQKQYQKMLHRVDLRCFEPEAARRISDAMALIEAEWLLANERGEPMVIEIRDNTILLRR